MSATSEQEPSVLDVLRSQWDTYSLFEQMREHSPIRYVPELNAWLLFRYEDIQTVVGDNERFGSMPADLVGEVPAEVAEDLPNGYAPWQPALVNTDGELHRRIRRLAQKPLTPKAVALHEDAVRREADALLDEIAPRGRADLTAEFAAVMPVRVLGHILGIPPEDQRKFRDWTLGIVELFVPAIPQERRIELAREQVDFNNYLADAITRRRESPGDDLFSGLILAQEQNEKSLTDLEIIGVVGQLIIAGFETSAGAISWALYQLSQNPDLLARVRGDFTLIPQVVEETLRRLTPARGVVRRVNEDVEIGGQKIAEGSNIFAMVQSGNNDEAQFECPAKFDIDRSREEMRRSLHFGAGEHTCIGQSVARLDLRIAIERSITRLPNLRLAADQDIQVQDGMIFHRPESLVFEWDV